jgi:hypothetical protein
MVTAQERDAHSRGRGIDGGLAALDDRGTGASADAFEEARPPALTDLGA